MCKTNYNHRIILPSILNEDETRNEEIRHELVQDLIQKIKEAMAEHNLENEESERIYFNVEFGSGPTRPEAWFYERGWKATKRGINAAWRHIFRWTKAPIAPDRKYLGD